MDHANDVAKYISGVQNGSIVAGRHVISAVERHVADLTSGEKRGIHFDASYANEAINFVRVLNHTTGEYAGEQFEPRLWQKFILWCLFGWRRGELRRFRWAFITVARGNGKSPLSAAIAN